jgi:hypothetical protein
MSGALAQHAVEALWGCIIDAKEDQTVRSELLQLWVYMFPQNDELEVAPRLLAEVSTSLPADDDVTLASDLTHQRLLSANPLDTYTRARYHLLSGAAQDTRRGQIDNSSRGMGATESNYEEFGKKDGRHRHKSKRSRTSNQTDHDFFPTPQVASVSQPKEKVVMLNQTAILPVSQEGPPVQKLRLSLGSAASNQLNKAKPLVRKISLTLKEF